MIQKVMLINPENSGRGIKMLKPPFGLLSIASIFLKRGVDIVWIDADLLRHHPNRIYQLINANTDVDLIAIGGLHTAYSSVKSIFEYLQNQKIDIPVILGGRIAQTLDYLLWQKIPNLQMICKQEGEYVIDSLCNHFPNFEKVLGLELKKNAKIIKNPAASIVESLDKLPPIPWNLLDRQYFKKGTANILTGRGCPFSCNFCRIKPDRYRVGSISRVLDEIKYLADSYDLNKIVVMDEFFLQNKSRVAQLCDGMKELNLAWLCTSRGDAIKKADLDLLRKMAKSGCKKILMGIESGSQTILNSMNKRVNVSSIEISMRLIRKAGLKVKPTFIFGFPGETRETALENVKWRLKMESFGLYYRNKKGKYFYATPYPGTRLYSYFKERYRLTLDEEEDWIMKSPGLKVLQVNLTDLDMEELVALDKECKWVLRNHTPITRFLRHEIVKFLPRTIF